VDSVGFVVHYGRPRAIEVAEVLATRLVAAGIVSRSIDRSVEGDRARRDAPFTEGVDLVISVGGDGTLLRAARLADRAGGVPLLAVNVGRLGFLTEVGPDDAIEALDELLAGDVLFEERIALIAEPEGAPWNDPQWAFNEIIVEKRARHRLVAIASAVDGVPLTTYSADGLIVSTPTGSTAYSFSARGPIVSPRLSCMLLTPVAPHMLFDRPVLLAPDEVVHLEVVGDEPGLLSADGRLALELPVGARVHVRTAPRPVRLVRRKGSPSFYAVLREKFALPAGQAPHAPAHPPVQAD
jgi:NAD+ kinase